MGLNEFPTDKEIFSSAPEGRVPYIRLSLLLSGIAAIHDANMRHARIAEGIQMFAKADNEGVAVPPLPEPMSDMLQRAAERDLVVSRRRTPDDPLRDGDPPIIMRDSSRQGLLLLHAIADFGAQPVVGE